MVRNPVRTTTAKAIASSSSTPWGRRARITFVPLNKKCLARAGWIEGALKFRYLRASSVSGTLETGTDSPVPPLDSHQNPGEMIFEPVSMLSFTIQSPDNKIQSQGTWFREGSENS